MRGISEKRTRITPSPLASGAPARPIQRLGPAPSWRTGSIYPEMTLKLYVKDHSTHEPLHAKEHIIGVSRGRVRTHSKPVLSPLAPSARPIQRLGSAPSCRAPSNCPMTPRSAFSSTPSLRGCCLQTEVRSRHRARRGCAEGRARAPTLSMCGGDGSGQRCRSSPGTCSRGLAGWEGCAFCPELTRGSHSHQG